MKIIFISDTHGQHAKLNLASADMIIHCGDISSRGNITEVTDFLNWFSSLKYEYKIFIAGNHDFFFEKASTTEIETILPNNIIYLNDSGITVNGINIWGSPIQPWFYDWAFNRKRGKQIQKHWNLIPTNTDILITHGPPLNILDRTQDGTHVGCQNLLDKIQNINLRVHAFGHIHEAYGIHQKSSTTFINASVLDLKYKISNEAILFEYE